MLLVASVNLNKPLKQKLMSQLLKIPATKLVQSVNQMMQGLARIRLWIINPQMMR